jgi:hypothetical protein
MGPADDYLLRWLAATIAWHLVVPALAVAVGSYLGQSAGASLDCSGWRTVFVRHRSTSAYRLLVHLC